MPTTAKQIASDPVGSKNNVKLCRLALSAVVVDQLVRHSRGSLRLVPTPLVPHLRPGMAGDLSWGISTRSGSTCRALETSGTCLQIVVFALGGNLCVNTALKFVVIVHCSLFPFIDILSSAIRYGGWLLGAWQVNWHATEAWGGPLYLSQVIAVHHIYGSIWRHAGESFLGPLNHQATDGQKFSLL